MGRRFVPFRMTRRNDAAQAEADGHSEVAWKAMTAIEADESDRWNDIEEHWLRVQDHDAKRWKYFAK